jgi:hypothetical protein
VRWSPHTTFKHHNIPLTKQNVVLELVQSDEQSGWHKMKFDGKVGKVSMAYLQVRVCACVRVGLCVCVFVCASFEARSPFPSHCHRPALPRPGTEAAAAARISV